MNGETYLIFGQRERERFHGNGYSLGSNEKKKLIFNVTPVNLPRGKLADRYKF